MKKVVSVVLVALMVLGLSVTAFAADGKVTVVADKTEAKAGETVVLTIKGEGFDKVGALAISVALDDKLELADKGIYKSREISVDATLKLSEIAGGK